MHPNLSPLEDAVVAAALAGKTTVQTAELLNYSAVYIKRIRRGVCDKLGTQTFMQAVAIVVRHETVEEIRNGS